MNALRTGPIVIRRAGDPALDRIEAKLARGERLDREDGVALCTAQDLRRLGELANAVREARHGDRTYFNTNLHLNATNVCEADCHFCSFARLDATDARAWTHDPEAYAEEVARRLSPRTTELHMVNGLHPGVPFSYYTELLRRVRARAPQLHIKAFTAVEIHYFSVKYGMSYEEVLERLVEAGLGSLPGGGAEIFAPRVRRKICPDKADAAAWLEVHRVAHRMGLVSNCTMLYGHVERVEERVDHLLALRELQDETGGFQCMIPLAFLPEGNALARLPGPGGFENLRVYAATRLLLDNVAHLKAYWVMVGPKIAQVAQHFGVDDLDGTVVEEKIYRMAGTTAPEALTRGELIALIADAGRTPVERNTTYEVIETYGPDHPERAGPRRRALPLAAERAP